MTDAIDYRHARNRRSGIIPWHRRPRYCVAYSYASEVLEVRVSKIFRAVQFAPLVLDRPGGRFIVTSSIAEHLGMDRRAVYAATKAGLAGVTRSLAVEWGGFGATVNALAPGLIRTPLLAEDMTTHPERVTAAIANTPLGRIGEPEDVADVAAFLASDEARFITGQTIGVDGGLSAGIAWW